MSNNDFVTADDIFSFSNAPMEVREVPLPWLGEDKKAYLKALSEFEKEQWEKQNRDVDKKGNVTVKQDNFRARLVVRMICTPDGKLLFEDAKEQARAANALRNGNSVILAALFLEAAKMIGLTEEDVEELEKKYKKGNQSDSSID